MLKGGSLMSCLKDPAILELDEKCKGFSMLVSQLDRRGMARSKHISLSAHCCF